MNANIMNMQIFLFLNYDLNGHIRSQKVTFKFILTLTYVLMDNCLSLFYIILILFVKKIGELTKPRICKISRVLKPLKKRIVPLILTNETITLIYNLEWSAEKFKPYVDHCLKVKITINISFCI